MLLFKHWKISSVAVFLLIIITLANILNTHFSDSSTADSNGGFTSRHLLTSSWETCNFESDNSKYVFIIPYVFVAFLCFIGLALICDDFFVPSLEAITEKLDLSEDVAGATFMAVGSSAPELFISLAAVSVTDSDIGVGTLIGSGVFNILIIIALSALLAGKTLYLDWRPLLRDSVVYGGSIIFFIGFSWNGYLDWYEALVLLLLYLVYIVMMKFNGKLMKLLLKTECSLCKSTCIVAEEQDAELMKQDNGISGSSRNDVIQRHRFIHSHRGELASSISNRRKSNFDYDKLHPPHHHGNIDRCNSHSPNELKRTDHSGTGGTSHGIATSKATGSVVAVAGTNTVSTGITISTGTTVEASSADTTLSINHQLHTTSISSRAIDGSLPVIIEDALSTDTTGLVITPRDGDSKDPTITIIPFLPPIKASPPDYREVMNGGVLDWIRFICSMSLFVISFPFLVVFTWTVPDCTNNRKWYIVGVSFVMSVFWIAAISVVMVIVLAKICCVLDIGQFTMGMVIIAIGTSLPDTFNSILVARDGFGDMAVSNAIGSNIFNITIGVGIPYLIRICIDGGKAFLLLTGQQLVDYNADKYTILPHPKFSFILLLVLTVSMTAFTTFKYKLNSFVGLSFVAFYLLFLTYTFIQDTVCNGGIYC